MQIQSRTTEIDDESRISILTQTINQLINIEPSLEGKINRLYTLIEQIDICGQNY